jgi:hypothetical protein
MPDEAIVQPQAPQVKKIDVLAGGETPGFTGRLSREQEALRQAHDKKTKIENARKENPDDPRRVLEKVAEVPEYTSADLKETVDAVGADNELKTSLEPLTQYLEAVKKAKRNGTELATELGGDANTIQETVGKLLAERGGLYEKFPELRAIFANESELYKYIEQNIGRDIGFQREIVKILTETKDKAKNIRKTDTAEGGLEETKNAKDNLEALQASIKSRIESVLTGQGLTSDQITQISTYLDLGDTPENVLRQTRSLVRTNKNIDPSMEQYSTNYTASENHSREIAELEDQLTNERRNIGNNQAPRRPQEIQRLEDLKRKAEDRRDAAERNKKALQDAYALRNPDTDGNPMSDTDFNAKYQEYLAITSVFDADSPLIGDFAAAIENQKKIKELSEKIKQIESNPESAKSDQEKTDIIRELEGAVDVAMARFLTKRYDELVTDSDILLQASIKEAEKSGKTWKAAALTKIKSLSKGIRTYDNTKKQFVYDKDEGKIAKTLSTLAEYSSDGKDGTRKLFAETIGFKTDPEELKIEVAKQIGGARATYEGLTDQQKLDADSIIAQRTKDFEDLYAEQGEGFKKTLFESYFANRGFMDRIGHGELSLTDDEIKILNSQFGDLMESQLENSSLMKILKEKGVVPENKLKILLALLALLGIGAVAVVGVAPAAIAVGGAAKGIGSAAWN